jgi:hypothetical protein
VNALGVEAGVCRVCQDLAAQAARYLFAEIIAASRVLPVPRGPVSPADCPKKQPPRCRRRNP